MGTRINVLLDHDLSDYRDRAAVLARLAPSLGAALAVRDYWLAADPQLPHDPLAEWRADSIFPCTPDLHRYTGPGSLFLKVMPRAARIHTGGRWRGFLTIEPLRQMHLSAFRSIGGALGASCLALYPDSCEVDDWFWGGQALWECVEGMERRWGPPQPSVEAVDARVAATAVRTVPQVWLIECSRSDPSPK